MRFWTWAGFVRRYAPASLLFIASLISANAAEGKFRLLHSFASQSDGAYVYAGLVQDKAGNLYGMSELSGDGDNGVVFKISADGAFTVLHAFDGNDGASPLADLILDDAGNLYGTTPDGGDGCAGRGCGVVFRLGSDGTETVLHSFAGRRNRDGDAPYAGVIRDDAGNLYGTTTAGGRAHRFQDYGAVFKLAPDGAEALLHSFRGPPDGTDGLTPFSALVADRKGNLFGTTARGGLYGVGTVFKVARSGKERVLYSFAAGTDGRSPATKLVIDKGGNLYGTTIGGGGMDAGTVFKVAPDGSETVLHAFTFGDGADPSGGLIVDSAGNLCGTTVGGGAHSDGTIFKLSPDGALTVLHDFSGTTADGAFPSAGLVMDKNGNFYGTTAQGGEHGYGTVFELSKTRAEIP